MSDDIEVVRRALMMRDAGYGEPTHIWEQVANLLKEHDRLRAALAEAELEGSRLRARISHMQSTHECEMEINKAALAEAERKLKHEAEQTEIVLNSYATENQQLSDRAERASIQIAELQEQLHHLYGVEQRAERAEVALDGARAQCRADIAAMQREIARAERAEVDLAAAREALQRIVAILERAATGAATEL